MKLVGNEKMADVSCESTLGYVKESDKCSGECTCCEENVGPSYMKPTDLGVKNPDDITKRDI